MMYQGFAVFSNKVNAGYFADLNVK